MDPTGRLGNKLCQYSSFWALQRREWLQLPVLPEACARQQENFLSISYFHYGESGTGLSDGPLLLLDHPCSLTEFHPYRRELLQQLRWRPEVRSMYNGSLVGDVYLRRALELCRQRYHRPVFVVSSDDLAWCGRHLAAADVVLAGSTGAGAAGRDMALLAQCNHTVMTHGTYGFFAAFLAGGDVVVPVGFGTMEDYLTSMMRSTGFNLTTVPVE
ncbi:galactoside alpha-(1,2)-fucosyltransferase 2-like [Pollicipes pollicipes]|uniref:galactoside alpha-(1,2)-fucosyltransferase 2-like n=1 Tax=Pollicipes pollicipes TaxID=41117 RepID=UPI001885758B|nr:galactoside alpha-(1,2)-fucosyltransferase 2-like [Pollicipes pollicipes]